MKKTLFHIFVFLIPLAGTSQKTDFNFIFGAGGNTSFANSSMFGSAFYEIDKIIGMNVFLNKKNRVMVFNPGFTFCFNHYEGKINNGSWVFARQEMLGLNLDILMRITKRNYLRFGIFINKLIDTGIELTYGTGNGYYSYGNNGINQGYSPSDIQAGVVVGLCLPFKTKRRAYKFDLNVQQSGNAFVNADYYATNNLTGEKVKTFSTKTYPTRFLVALEINLKKIKRPKAEEEE